MYLSGVMRSEKGFFSITDEARLESGSEESEGKGGD